MIPSDLYKNVKEMTYLFARNGCYGFLAGHIIKRLFIQDVNPLASASFLILLTAVTSTYDKIFHFPETGKEKGKQFVYYFLSFNTAILFTRIFREVVYSHALAELAVANVINMIITFIHKKIFPPKSKTDGQGRRLGFE